MCEGRNVPGHRGMRIWLAKHDNAFRPTDEESEKILRRMEDGEARPFKPIRVRSLRWHKKYWANIGETWHCVNEIQIPVGGGHHIDYKITCQDDLHEALKLLTGLYDTYPIVGTDFAIRKPKSTSFDEMEEDEWTKHYRAVQDAIFEHVVPLIARGSERRHIEGLWT